MATPDGKKPKEEEEEDGFNAIAPTANQEVSNTNHFSSVSDSLGRVAATSECMASKANKVITSLNKEIVVSLQHLFWKSNHCVNHAILDATSAELELNQFRGELECQ